MQRVIFTNARGQSVELKSSAPFLLQSIDGLGDVGADIQMQKAPFQDGSAYIDSVLQERSISLEVAILSKDKPGLLRQRQFLASVFNPKLGPGKLRYENGDTVREIEAVPDGVPIFPDGVGNRGPIFQRTLVNLLCPNPYWKSPTITEEPAFEGLFQFPFEGEFQMGIQRDERIIYNDGDAPAPINVIFYGPAQTPTIANLTTGEFIRINKSLGENEKLIVDTSDDNKSVYFEDENGNRINVFHWIDLDSTFFKLQVGENEISCMCATSNLSKDFEIYYRKLYIAV